ncbi:tripartite tricarboxylate transporter substrate binding protein [Orrella sp. JC864]|uniref:Bug family tripartite tricarboxylate transporter substrate binding protein n=1 Tax=Orrella sp. JC864 TaxID=3120298 RepID=UPI00300B3442
MKLPSLPKLAMGLLLGLAVPAAAWAADDYPSRPIRLVVPFPAGSTTDVMARFLGERVGRTLGQTFIVENKAGAQGSIAAADVSRAAPDGYTLLVGTNSTQSANVHLFKSLPYDPTRDFAAITQFTTNPLVLVIRPDLPPKDLPGFLDYVRQRPGELNYGTGNSGSLAAVQMLKEQAGIDALDVPYAGTPQAMNDLLAGRLDFMITDISVTRPHIEAGKLRPLGVTPPEPSPALPGVPPLAQAGLPGYDFVAWGGLFAPAGTDAAIIDKLNQAFVQALRSDEAAAFFDKQGLQPTPRTPQDFSRYVAEQTELWGRLLSAAGQAKQ